MLLTLLARLYVPGFQLDRKWHLLRHKSVIPEHEKMRFHRLFLLQKVKV